MSQWGTKKKKRLYRAWELSRHHQAPSFSPDEEASVNKVLRACEYIPKISSQVLQSSTVLKEGRRTSLVAVDGSESTAKSHRVGEEVETDEEWSERRSRACPVCSLGSEKRPMGTCFA